VRPAELTADVLEPFIPGLREIGLRYQFPWARHYLGIALEGLKRWGQAARAFEVAVEQSPNLLEAHRRLEHLYAHKLARRPLAEEHTRAIEAIGERVPDGDNPRGYYECEPAKRLMTDRIWLPEADGKVVKIVAQLLPYLPPRPHRFQIIFMERDLDEVYASQEVMLENLDKDGARLPPEKLKQAYAGQIQALKRLLGEHGAVATLWLDHAEVLTEPHKIARRIELFLGRDMDLQAMTAVVDPTLHRQRKERLARVAD
jgi:hypothetical protein